MKNSDWEAQLVALIKRHSGKHPLPAFRNAFGDAVREATSRGKLDETDARLLEQVRSRLEHWRSAEPPTLDDAWAEWLALQSAASSRIPASILDVLMTRLPGGKGERAGLKRGQDGAVFEQFQPRPVGAATRRGTVRVRHGNDS